MARARNFSTQWPPTLLFLLHASLDQVQTWEIAKRGKIIKRRRQKKVWQLPVFRTFCDRWWSCYVVCFFEGAVGGRNMLAKLAQITTKKGPRRRNSCSLASFFFSIRVLLYCDTGRRVVGSTFLFWISVMKRGPVRCHAERCPESGFHSKSMHGYP